MAGLPLRSLRRRRASARGRAKVRQETPAPRDEARTERDAEGPRPMILNAHGVVLARRQVGEYDRLATVFTEDLGKLTVRFVGVARSASKLKALAEPAAWGD